MDNLSPITKSVSKDSLNGRVLIVDDDDMVRLLTRQALEELNLDIKEASNGVECLQHFKHAQFDLVLLDLKMPEMDGFEVCAKLRQMPGGKDTAILVITGLDDHRSIHRAYELGATDFITKPINWPILVQRIRYILRAQKNLFALRENEFTLSEAQRLAKLGNWDWNILDGTTRWSEEALRILGRRGRLSYDDFIEAVHPDDRKLVNDAFGNALKKGGSYTIEHRILHPDGSEKIVTSQGLVVLDELGRPTRFHNVIQDITKRKRAEEQIHRLSYYNERTGLPNRNLFTEQTNRALLIAQDRGQEVSLILLNLDRFKRINDSLGHTIGDDLLKYLAQRISDALHDSGLVKNYLNRENGSYFLAHVNGDEFLITLRGTPNSSRVANFTRNLLKQLSRPIKLNGREIYITASAGIAIYPSDSQNLSELLKNADIALSHAKKAGGNCFRFYAAEMNSRALERLSLESRLNRALEKDELKVFYQPQIELATGKMVGMEALLRWQLPDGTIVSPADFIPLAEETGLIVPIGAWVLSTACSQLATWKTLGYQPVQIAVNLSPRQFSDKRLVETVRSALRVSSIQPDFIELELTESTIMQDADTARKILQKLKSLGIKLAIDDFGTGYSSMNYLKYFPLDSIKIDRSFIRDLDVDQCNIAIVKAIIALSHGLGLTTICEGVETEEQRQLLKELGSDQIQGFLISRPLPADQIVTFLDKTTTSLA
ncbi:MAG: hypothetical protein AXA67_01675 [Methylothermaceae bacteria B42]|nr:MAG: hypothetical protein AXA67_01675 [Methylothermaceae bacteria B42]HHJ38034.1 EAL domain-containing protein [Methylothermaceae bacterium]